MNDSAIPSTAAIFRPSGGYSLIELMIAVAILTILAGISIPLYRGYVLEGHFTTMRSTMDGLRTPLEDFRLDNGSYGATGTLVGQSNIDGRFGWTPIGDMGNYQYTVSVTGTNSYDVWGVSQTNAGVWVRCDNRFTNCCDAETSSAVTSACP